MKPTATDIDSMMDAWSGYITAITAAGSATFAISAPPKGPYLPEAWQFLDNNIQKNSPRWFVAGGALRDSIFGMPVKDVDVFVPISDKRSKLWKAAANEKKKVYLTFDMPHTQFEFVTEDSVPLGMYAELQKSSDPDYEIGNFVAYQCEEVPGLNVIFYYDSGWTCSKADMWTKINNFPHNISQIGSYMGELLMTAMFKYGARKKEIIADKEVDGIHKYNRRLYEKGYNPSNGWKMELR